MKTKIIGIALIVLLGSCNTKVKKENENLKAETLKLKQENETFQSQNKKLNASIEGYKVFLKEVDENLKSIDVNATMVGKVGKDGKGNPDTKEMIRARIASIKALMDNSKLKLIALDRSLNEMRKKYGDQSEEVLALNNEIKAQARMLLEKEAEFVVLKSELEADVEELELAYEKQLALTQELNNILNRAYYFAGSSKDLKQKGIVDKEGGFIGLGQVKVLNANSEDQLFSAIRKDSTSALEFNAKSIKLITEHPEGSYSLTSTKDKTQLVISDKKLFWKSTNYLVVQL